MRKPENILRHELIGLECEIVGSMNRSQIGLKGKIIDETMKTMILETDRGRKRIEKKGTMFSIKLDNKKVSIDGNYIAVRPEDRIKKTVSRW